MINKLHSVKEDRRDAWEMTEAGLELASELGNIIGDRMQSDNEVLLSEEEDHNALQPDSDCSVSAYLMLLVSSHTSPS